MKTMALVALLLAPLSAPAQVPNHAIAEHGEILIYTPGPNRLVIAVDSGSKADGLVDQWFVLQTDATIPPYRTYLPSATFVFRDGNLKVTAGKQTFEFSVSETPPETPAFAENTRIQGYGLSRIVAPTDVRVRPIPARGLAEVASDDACEGYCEDSLGDAFPDYEGSNTGGGTTCDAGGLGATSCSITSGPRTCSVTCNSSSYPCCRFTSSGSVSCTCKHN